MARSHIDPLPRTCRELLTNENEERRQLSQSRPLAEFRDTPAYVLLGDPGLGKSTSFQMEAASDPDSELIGARDFITFDVNNQTNWQGKTLFIDGLDEIRVGGNDPRMPIDQIRQNLDRLGRPHFRISCRHADWLLTDQKSLDIVSPSGDVNVLYLDQFDTNTVRNYLEQISDPNEVKDFILEAQHQGIEGLLFNPQTLNMLVDTVSEHGWPSSRTELFEYASRSMTREFNDEHLDAKQIASDEQVLDAAGRICAVLLLSNTVGVATSHTSVSADFPDIGQIGLPRDLARGATSTNLFRSQANHVEFVHRHVAEFLAARCLASMIEKGFPVPRVLANMTDAKGNVVSTLRGLSAWLAVHSQIARRFLMSRDPVGVALYGEIKDFSDDERFALFQYLIQDPIQLTPTYKSAKAFSPIVSPAMLDVLERTLRLPPDDSNAPIVRDFIFRLFAESPPVDCMRDTFFEFVRDESQPSHVKLAALIALVKYTQCYSSEDSLVPLADDIIEGHISDPNDELLGELLTTLFPKWITASEVWGYFKEGNKDFIGRYSRFWIHDLIVTVSEPDLANLLDQCESRITTMSERNTFRLRTCITRLLIRGLEVHGDDISTKRLYDWLNVGVKLSVSGSDEWLHFGSIRQWIAERPHLHAEIVSEGVLRLTDERWYATYEVKKRLYDASVSDGFYQDCITSVTKHAKSNRSAARSLLEFVVWTNALDDERIRNLLVGETELTKFVNGLIATKRLPTTEIDPSLKQTKVLTRPQRREQEQYEALKKLEPEFIRGTAPPSVLHRLAAKYFGDFHERGHKSAMERISQLVKSDASLIDAIERNLRQVATRNDLPRVDESLQLARKSKLHFLGWPLLASIALKEGNEGYDPSSWSDDQMRKALAIYFGYAHGMYRPLWYDYMIEYKPAVVAEVQILFADALLKDGRSKGDISLWQLAFDAKHKAVAELAALPLLKTFPIVANRDLLPDLEYLLIAALQYVCVSEFKEIIASKLQLKSMPTRQRARWLAAGCVLDLDKYTQNAIEFVGCGRTQSRLRDFLSFFCQQSEDYTAVNKSDLRLQEFLIHLAGPYIDPEAYATGGIVTTEMDMSWRIRRYIQDMANDPRSEATVVLDSLLQNSDLAAWHKQLERRSVDQQRIRTDHEFVVPNFTQMCEFLNNRIPTNPADLGELVISMLDEFAESVRRRDTDDWKRFWNEDGYGRPENPKSENSCTQLVLTELRYRLPESVHAELYGSYAGGTSADLKIAHENYNVPIEAKGSWHRDLWYAAKSQLMTKYTIDSATNGFGIYLVYWFGQEHTKRAPEGTVPNSASELKQLLEASLSEQERRRIFIAVVDLSET